MYNNQMLLPVTPSFESSPSLEDKFKFLAEQLSAQITAAGHDLKPYVSPELPLFSKLPEDVKGEVVDGLLSYYNLCVSAQNAGHDLLDTNFTTTWWAIRECGLHPHESMFTRLQPGDIIEIYDRAGKQIYRSFRMFFLLSYSLEELSTHQWWQLFSRDESITRRMFEGAQKILSGETRGCQPLDLEDHVVEEIFSPKRKRSVVRHKFVAPLFNKNKEVTSFASVFRVLNTHN